MKLGVVQKGPGGPGGIKGEAKGLEAEGKDGAKTEKGALLGADGALLAGLGFNIKDHRTSAKNVAEQANLERFLQEMNGEPKELGGKKGAEEGPMAQKGAAREGKEARGEAKDAPADAKAAEQPRDKADEARVQGRAEAQEPAAAREAPEKAEAEQQGQQQHRDDQSDDEDKPGGAWIMEEIEGEQVVGKRGLRSADALGHAHRCNGTIEDGTRCLRKPVKGTPYCREHFVPVAPPRQP